ncbi:MAG: hypothetical protein JXR71_11770 [Bacteroidales bacterium]|nr:hypothetical protein [Bacteroidales bacterium]
MIRTERQHKEPGILLLLRLLLGLVFLFSSFVKGVDPLGTSYKVEDYLMVFGWNVLIPYALVLSYGVILLEFLLGFALVFKAFLKQTLWATLLVLIFFTVLTYVDARQNLVSDCGCFGDAVKLTNWQTFYKNIGLLVVLLILLLAQFRYRVVSLKSGRAVLLLFFAAIALVSFMSYNLMHLPIIDFRPWKVGQVFHSANQDKQKVFVSYRNKKTGQVKEFLFPDYPWRDSTWMKQWVFVGQRVEKNKSTNPVLVIQDSTGADRFQDVFAGKGFHLVLVSYDIRESNSEAFRKMEELTPLIKQDSVQTVLLTASDRTYTRQVLSEYGLKMPVYFADEVTLKAMIRSNPGLILLHNGVLIKKWAFQDFPTPEHMKNRLDGL